MAYQRLDVSRLLVDSGKRLQVVFETASGPLQRLEDVGELLVQDGKLVVTGTGGGGGGVASVTGDGVGGTATNIVLTYPTPEDIGAASESDITLAEGQFLVGGGAGNEKRIIQSSDLGITGGSQIAVSSGTGGQEEVLTGVSLSANATAGSIARRTPGGQIVVTDAVNANEATTLGQLDTKLDIPTGTPSATVYARGDGTWATPPNTTYSVITEANIQNPASTTSGLITGQRIASAIEGRIVPVAASKTLALTDRLTYQRVTSASTITIPANATVAFPIGTEINFFQAGTGIITFAIAGGVTVNSYGDTLVTDGKGAAATLKNVATDEWDLTI